MTWRELLQEVAQAGVTPETLCEYDLWRAENDTVVLQVVLIDPEHRITTEDENEETQT